MLSLLEGREYTEWLYLVLGVGQRRCREIFNMRMLISYTTSPGRCGYMDLCMDMCNTSMSMRMGEAGAKSSQARAEHPFLIAYFHPRCWLEP